MVTAYTIATVNRPDFRFVEGEAEIENIKIHFLNLENKFSVALVMNQSL
jgi:hypothetical protein